MYFYCICEKEGDLHVLLFRHLLPAPLVNILTTRCALGGENLFFTGTKQIKKNIIILICNSLISEIEYITRIL